MADTKERLQKVLASAGIASRRQCEEFIAEGRVTVDGEIVTEMGVKVDPAKQKITFDGKPIREEKKIYYLLNKPKGYISTRSHLEGEPGKRVVDLIPRVEQNLQTVGRLDKDSEGLIILTNDGELINLLTHPKHQIAKKYLVKVRGRLEDAGLATLREGVFLAEGRARTGNVVVRYTSNKETILEIVLRQGLNRQIRRMCSAIEHPVRQLKRIAIDGIIDQNLKTGQYRRLSNTEVEQLYTAARKERAQEKAKA